MYADDLILMAMSDVTSTLDYNLIGPELGSTYIHNQSFDLVSLGNFCLLMTWH